VAKLRKRRGMIDPKEFDEPTIGKTVGKAKEIIGRKLKNALSDADLAKQRLLIDLNRDKVKATDFDDKPPEPQEPIKPETPFTTDEEKAAYDKWTKINMKPGIDETDYKIPDNELPAVILPPPPGGSPPIPPGRNNRDWKDILKDKVSSAKGRFGGSNKGTKEKSSENEFEKPLNISDSQADYYASLCGHTKSIKTLRMEYQVLKASIEKTNYDREAFASNKSAKRSMLAELEKQRDALVAERQLIYDSPVSSNDELAKNEKKAAITNLTNKISNLRSEISQLETELSHTGSEFRLSQKETKIAGEWDKLKNDFSAYYMAVNCGQKKYEKEHGWRSEASNFASNAENMLGGGVKINPVTDVVGYGGMTGKSAVGGINAIAGGVKVSDTANSWTRTNVGDRQLVESLVTVRPNRAIAPFGAPGTIGESNLQNQFQYSSPLKKIGVGDVTARGGYQLRLEDIHRKKNKSHPKIVRKKVIEKKKVMGNNKALKDAMSMVNNQRLVDIKVPTVAVKNVKGSGGEPPMKGIVVLNNLKDITLGKTTMSVGMKGINNVMANAVEATTKRAKGKKVK